MSDLSDVDAALIANALGPQSAGNKSENATAHSLSDQMALRKMLAADAAVASPGLALRAMTVKLIPPGAP